MCMSCSLAGRVRVWAGVWFLRGVVGCKEGPREKINVCYGNWGERPPRGTLGCGIRGSGLQRASDIVPKNSRVDITSPSACYALRALNKLDFTLLIRFVHLPRRWLRCSCVMSPPGVAVSPLVNPMRTSRTSGEGEIRVPPGRSRPLAGEKPFTMWWV